MRHATMIDEQNAKRSNNEANLNIIGAMRG